MNKSTRPLLMDITLVIVSGGLSIEVYPFPIPDLFKGCPVAVAGAWTGTGAFPSTITVCGRMPGGEQLSFPVEVRTAETGFLNQALGSFRIDSIVSAYWMKQNNDKEKAGLKQKAIDASIEASIPCVFTQSVAYQTRFYLFDICIAVTFFITIYVVRSTKLPTVVPVAKPKGKEQVIVL